MSELHTTLELLEGVKVPQLGYDEAVIRTINGTEILPSTRVADVAKLCGWLSCDKYEVFARIECRQGKPVTFLVREPREANPIPAFLRRQAD